jgi:hypothetical protein
MSEDIGKILKFAELYSEAAGPRNEYMKEYMAKRYHNTRDKIYKRLGGKCKMCGNKEGPFHLDHIDSSKKTMRAADLHSVNDGKFEEEIRNLAILCVPCHKKKTVDNHDFAQNPTQHGSYWMARKYKCKCDACVKAYKEKQKEWREKAKNKV